MSGSFVKGAVVGLICAVLGGATVALAGSGVGGVFNLGQTNTVNAASNISGSTNGSLLGAYNSNTGANAVGVNATSASPTASALLGINNSSGVGLRGQSSSGIGVFAQTASTSQPAMRIQNTGGFPAGSFLVNNNSIAPFRVNSTAQVANLNADLLDGLDSTALQQRVTGTCSGTHGMSYMQVVNSDGTVGCSAEQGALITANVNLGSASANTTTDWQYIGSTVVTANGATPNTSLNVSGTVDITSSDGGTTDLLIGVCYQAGSNPLVSVTQAHPVLPTFGYTFSQSINGYVGGQTGSFSLGLCTKQDSSNVVFSDGSETLTWLDTIQGNSNFAPSHAPSKSGNLSMGKR